MEIKFFTNLKRAAERVYPHNEVMQRVVVTQAVHESGLLSKRGGSQLAIRYNNLFGIKGKGSGGSVKMPTWESVNGVVKHVRADFAVYMSHEDCFEAHKNLMENGVSWNHNLYKPVLEARTVQGGFEALQKCGYATDPKYALKLSETYEKLLLRGLYND